MVHLHLTVFSLALLVLTGLVALIGAIYLFAQQRRFLLRREVIRSRRELKEVIEQLPFGVLVVDADTAAVRLFNAEAERLFGHPLRNVPVWEQGETSGVIGEDGEKLPEEGYALHKALLQGRRVGPRVQRYRRGDGQTVTLEISAAPVHDERGRMIFGVVGFQDVTGKLQAEEDQRRNAAVSESEAQFQLIADSAPVLLWISELNGRRRFANAAYVAFLGESYEDALVYDWRNALHPEDLPRIMIEQVAGEASLEPFTLEARYRRADGEWRWLHSFSRPRWDDTHHHAGFIGVAYDVTDAKRAQDGLLHLNELLEERVAAVLAEKAEAEAALAHAQKMEAVGRLTGGVAHDFNNLLTVVIGALDLILKHPEDEARRTRLGEAALSAARRGERLTQQLLAFSRKQTLKPEITDLKTLIDEGEPLLRRAVGEGIAFEVVHFSGPVITRIDPGQFEAALLNLVVNAVDATPQGGRVVVETLHCVDAPPELPPGPYVCVRVRDTGEGMSAAVMAQVFEPFFTTKGPGKGTGLGLSQVYGLARQSGGAATVESEPGVGTTVTLFLRAAEGSPEAVHPASPTSSMGDAPPLNILLVEDDPGVAAVLETMLRDLGHTAFHADSAAPALRLLEEGRAFDLLLTDVIMPGGMNGVELARRATHLRPEMKVLLSSGYAGDAFDETLTDAVWPLLRKPYTQAELADHLRAASGAG